MKHPYQQTVPIVTRPEDIPQYDVTLKMCTLYKGIPYGPAHLVLSIPGFKFYSFDGVGLFTDGELHGGPFTCVDGNGHSRSYT